MRLALPKMVKTLLSLVIFVFSVLTSTYICAEQQTPENVENKQENPKEDIKEAASETTEDKPKVLAIRSEFLQAASSLLAITENQKIEPSLTMQLPTANNKAEQYLAEVINAGKLIKAGNNSAAIEALEGAQKLNDDLVKEQLARDIFRQKHKLMAYAYTQINDYDKAYYQQREYIFKYFDDLDEKEKALNEQLKAKYQIEQKQQQKQLLEERNNLQQLQLNKTQSQDENNDRDIVLVVILSLILLSLTFRQLNIRRRLMTLKAVDPLTQIATRESLFNQGDKLIAVADNNESTICVVQIDLDHFSKINQIHGMRIGDKVLREFAALGREVMRSRDVFARFGGDQFVALMPGVSLDEAKTMAQRLQERVAKNQFTALPQPEDSSDAQLTVSIGVASMKVVPVPVAAKVASESTENHLSIAPVILAAEAALTIAKQQGRNQLVVG